ncbi:hypothetical protein AWB78_02205 [Caballeronia calidae]|uniref:Uncharacterized protein n=1 Tax=Caballeronia calidae TaxID=1777139 RepID=A0A158B151_9BURK|nr:hypothetical protein AWB78_02205 [Caballeronia calidae]
MRALLFYCFLRGIRNSVGLFALPLCGAAVHFSSRPSMESCFRFGLFALPPCGAAVHFFPASFYGILLSCRSISTAPVRGGSHFLCCCKESNQRNSYPHPKYFTPAPAQKHSRGPAVASALVGLTGLGSRTVCHIATHNKLVQHQIAPARFAADRSIGSARTSLLTLPSHGIGRRLVSLAYPSAARSAVPELSGAEPAPSRF